MEHYYNSAEITELVNKVKSLEKRVETQQLIIQEVLKKFDNSY